MRHIGYSLIDAQGVEIRSWQLADLSVAVGVPDQITLPNGDIVHAPQPGAIGEWRLVERWVVQNPLTDLYSISGYSVNFDGEKVVATEQYGPPTKDQIRARLKENDERIVRAITEGDTARIDAHKSMQAALRSQLQ